MISTAIAICEENVSIATDTANLSGVLAYPFAGDANVIALIAGPHPLLGGNLRSNVVRSLRQALAANGCAALTFDYRALDQPGTGTRDSAAIASEFWRDNHCPEENVWVDDLRWAARAITSWCGSHPVVLVGYSFGCWVVAQHAMELNPVAMILVSPNPRQHDFIGLESSRAPLLVIQSDDDFTCGLQEGEHWFSTLRGPKERRVLPSGGHFFRGCETGLAASVVSFLRDRTQLSKPIC